MPRPKQRTLTIKVDALARVEGEGALFIRAKDGQPQEVRLAIYEPPRFFEAFLRGRDHAETPDITARICGICPVAYQTSACNAIESLFGLVVPPEIRLLRMLLYYGEWIESHTLHVSMLHAPDFLGYDGVVQMAKDYPDVVRKALQLKKTGNQLMALIGGREIHPINVRIGGFYSAPPSRDLQALQEPLRQALDIAQELTRWVAGFNFPDFDQDYEFVALRHPDEYAILDGRIVSSKGIDVSASQFADVFEERQVSYSNALHCTVRERGSYLVGPMARFNLNFEQLSPLAQDLARSVGATPPLRNPFKSIIVRGIEIVHALDESLNLIERYKPPEIPALSYEIRPGTGHGASEAPRGLLYHRYRVDPKGTLEDAWIVPPTSQNQKRIEDDLWRFVPEVINLPKERATWICEQAVRNYDPCISCATHFLNLTIENDGDPK